MIVDPLLIYEDETFFELAPFNCKLTVLSVATRPFNCVFVIINNANADYSPNRRTRKNSVLMAPWLDLAPRFTPLVRKNRPASIGASYTVGVELRFCPRPQFMD